MSTQGSKYTRLQERIDYQFQDRAYLERALRHSSMGGKDNQRLEFLGDRVLGLTIATALFETYPEAAEGELAPRFNHLIRKETCAEIADDLRLGDEIKLGRSEAMSGGRRKIALLGDVIEALIAAIYLDGGYDAARKFIIQHWAQKLRDIPQNTVDAKTQLQELLQAAGEPTPQYIQLDRDGPDHAPVFTIMVKTKTHSAEAQGSNKRAAEQSAASNLLEQLKASK